MNNLLIFKDFRIFGNFLTCLRNFDWKSDTRHSFPEFAAKSGENFIKNSQKENAKFDTEIQFLDRLWVDQSANSIPPGRAWRNTSFDASMTSLPDFRLCFFCFLVRVPWQLLFLSFRSLVVKSDPGPKSLKTRTPQNQKGLTHFDKQMMFLLTGLFIISRKCSGHLLFYLSGQRILHEGLLGTLFAP